MAPMKIFKWQKPNKTSGDQRQQERENLYNPYYPQNSLLEASSTQLLSYGPKIVPHRDKFEPAVTLRPLLNDSNSPSHNSGLANIESEGEVIHLQNFGQTGDINSPKCTCPQPDMKTSPYKVPKFDERNWVRGRGKLVEDKEGLEAIEPEQQRRIKEGSGRARTLCSVCGIGLVATIVLLFVIAVVMHFALGWTLEGDCIGCR